MLIAERQKKPELHQLVLDFDEGIKEPLLKVDKTLVKKLPSPVLRKFGTGTEQQGIRMHPGPLHGSG